MPFAYGPAGGSVGTDQELLDIARAAIAQIMATGQAYSADGRQLTRADLPELRKTVEWLEQRIDSSAPSDNYVSFENP